MMKEKEGVKEKKKIKSLWEKVINKNVLKKGKTAVIYLRNNGISEMLEKESINGMFNINGKDYHEDTNCIYRTREGIPVAIIPEWSMIPYGTKGWHDKDMLEKMAECQNHVLRGIRNAEFVKMGEKTSNMKVTTKQIIVYGLLAIVALAIVLGYK